MAENIPVVNPPPPTRLLDFPVTVGMTVLVITVTVLLVVSGKFDHSNGVMTIAILITVTFAGAVIFCLIYTVPQDESTATIIGALTLAFGAVVSFIFRRNGNVDKH